MSDTHIYTAVSSGFLLFHSRSATVYVPRRSVLAFHCDKPLLIEHPCSMGDFRLLLRGQGVQNGRGGRGPRWGPAAGAQVV